MIEIIIALSVALVTTLYILIMYMMESNKKNKELSMPLSYIYRIDERPLSEKGVIITHNIGTARYSPKQAEEVINKFKKDYSDYLMEGKDKISHNFKVYKEYWLSQPGMDTNSIQIDII